jgi:hypothetical protein
MALPPRRILYTTHNITAALNRGGGLHTLGVMLGHGMWGNYHLTARPAASPAAVKSFSRTPVYFP